MKRHLWFRLPGKLLVMAGLPWLAVTFAAADVGMAVCFLLFFAVDPVYAVVDGYAAGKRGKAFWWSPLATGGLFLAGAWLFFDPGERAFLLYALVYAALGMLAYICGFFAKY